VPSAPPEEDGPEQVQGLYRRALDLVRGGFEERTWEMFRLTLIEDRAPDAVAAQFGVSAAAVRQAKTSWPATASWPGSSPTGRTRSRALTRRRSK
jgi:hypothetical protein